MTTPLHRVNAISTGVTAIVHVAHAGLVIGGAVVVLLMISPLAVRRRRAALAELRNAAASGNLVKLAELRAAGHDHASHSVDRRSPALLVAVVGSLIAAGVHVAVCPEHFHEGLRFGIFFVAISLFQTGWCIAVVRRPDRLLFLAGIAGNIGCVVLWLITRTIGLPFHIAEIEPFGLADTIASGAEVVTVFACAMLLGWSLRLRAEPSASAASQGGA